MANDHQDSAAEARDLPMTWFVILERARLNHDFELAARAQRELARLGVHVTYDAPRGKRKGASDGR